MLRETDSLFLISILHQTATERERISPHFVLFLISILHQTATLNSIVSSAFELFLISILHQTATTRERWATKWRLFLISILHQTATCAVITTQHDALFLISILHQTATLPGCLGSGLCCSLSVFYIKPQHYTTPCSRMKVVPYQYSTSNRNWLRHHAQRH